MSRLRVAFALLAAALLLPAGLFARRALEAQAAERGARHEALAARVFDEMERALSDFVRREEARPVGHYGFSWVPEGSVAGLAGRARTPLSMLPDDPDAPFVVGWFQIDPDGSVHSPLVPRLDEAPLGSPPRADAPARAALVREIVSAALPVPALRSAAAARPSGAAGSVPETGAAARAAPEAGADVAKVAPAPVPPGDPAPAARLAEAPARPNAFDALRSLNRGAQAREKRAPRVLVGPAAEAGREALAGVEPADAPAASRPGAASLAASAPEPDAARPPSGDAAHAEAWDEGSAEGAAAPVPAWSPPARAERPQATARSDAPAERKRRSPEAAAYARARRGDPMPRPPAAPARVVVDPFVGRLAGGHVLLLRTVLLDGRGTRQGVVVDPVRLAARLRDVSVGAAVLPAARLAFEPGGGFALGADPAGAFSFSHRFGAPFDGVSVELALAPLAEPAGERAARWLLLLLPATGVLGLLALYRMVAARLAFAHRRGQFVAAVSHELKTPLTAIRLIVEMLRDGTVDSEDKRRAYYATLTAEAERLSRLIDNVLEFSRLERGEHALALETAPLAPAVEELSAMLGAQAARAGSALELDLAGGLPPVRFERDALAQVLFNLVDNAQKYGRGPVSVALRAEGDRVVLAVADRGPGVPPADQGRLFEPFERGGDELTRESQGSGLGLALVRGLALRMGAAVAARNLPSGGFEVSLAFPATRA